MSDGKAGPTLRVAATTRASRNVGACLPIALHVACRRHQLCPSRTAVSCNCTKVLRLFFGKASITGCGNDVFSRLSEQPGSLPVEAASAFCRPTRRGHVISSIVHRASLGVSYPVPSRYRRCLRTIRRFCSPTVCQLTAFRWRPTRTC